MTRLANGRNGRDHVSQGCSYRSVSQGILFHVSFFQLRSRHLVGWHRLIRGDDIQRGEGGLQGGSASLRRYRSCPV